MKKYLLLLVLVLVVLGCEPMTPTMETTYMNFSPQVYVPYIKPGVNGSPTLIVMIVKENNQIVTKVVREVKPKEDPNVICKSIFTKMEKDNLLLSKIRKSIITNLRKQEALESALMILKKKEKDIVDKQSDSIKTMKNYSTTRPVSMIHPNGFPVVIDILPKPVDKQANSIEAIKNILKAYPTTKPAKP